MSELFKDPNQPALFADMNDPVLNATYKSMNIIGVDPEKKWDVRYIELAYKVSEWSKDPSTKIGCVVVGDKGQVLAQGYNGFPRGIEDSKERLNDRETKLKYVVHGEMNAIYNACYNGISLEGSTMYVTGLPTCSDCAKGVIQVGIKRVVWPKELENVEDRWKESIELTMSMFDEAGVKYEFV